VATDPFLAKRALRAELRQKRRTTPIGEREHASRGLTQQLIALARERGATSIAAYLSTNDEPSTRGFLAWAHAAGIRVLLPVSREDGLLDWAPYDPSSGAEHAADEELDFLGMPIPTTRLLGPIAINDVSLIIVPAAAVDRTGIRMGWGRGYFDRTIGSMAARPPVYAVIFDAEYLDEVPHERHDERVDGVVTPSQTITFPTRR